MNSEDKISSLALRITELEKSNIFNTVCCYLVALNYLFLFIRPQNDFEVIGSLKIPMVINALPIILWALNSQKNWTMPNLVMKIFLIGETLRSVIGKVVVDTFVVNDFWQFHTLKGLALEVLGLALPITIYFCNLSSLKLLLKSTLLIGMYLSVYGLTHQGMGPGGFLGDENDLGLALLFFLSYSLMFVTETELKIHQKVVLYFITLSTIVTIIATGSRGAFVGLVCVLGYCFLRSQKKLLFIFIGCLIFLSALPFIPKDYINEIKSISDTDSGTAEIRKHYWKLAGRVFMDTRNILTGVGLNNTSFNINKYETEEDLVKFPSAAGRVVHSLYFEILGDLGIWGVLIISYLFFSSYRTNNRNYLIASELKNRLEVAYQRMTKEEKTLDPLLERSISSSYKQISFLQPFCLSTNVSLIAIFSAGAFISVTYYPYIWLAVGISSCLKIYSRNLLSSTDQLLLHL